MEMEYTSSGLDSIIKMLQSIQQKYGDLQIFVEYKNKPLFLTHCMVARENNIQGIVLRVDDKPFNLEIASNETH